MHVLQSITKTVIFSMFGLVALGVTAWICRDLIEQPAIMAVILTAACLAAVGPAYVAYFWRNGARPVAFAVGWLTVLASLVLAYTETSYWSSSIEGMHEQATVEKTARDGQALVTNKRQERYANLANGQTPEQIQAKIDAKAVDARFARSNGCAGTTLGASSRAFCAEYFALKADLAAATEARNLESTVWAAGTKEEPFLKRNFYQAAMLGSENLGGTVSGWILGICFVLVVFLGSLLHLGFLIASSPVTRKEASGVAKSSPATPVAEASAPPAQPRTQFAELPIRDDLKRKAANSSEIPNGSPEPSPPGDSAPTPRAPIVPTIEPQRPKPELIAEDGRKLTKGEKKRRAAEKAERGASERIAAVEAFADQCLDIVPLIRVKGRSPQGGTKGEALRKEFRQWASNQQEWRHLATVDDSYLGRAFTAVIDAGRNAKGALYGAVMKVKQPVRRAA